MVCNILLVHKLYFKTNKSLNYNNNNNNSYDTVYLLYFCNIIF